VAWLIPHVGGLPRPIQSGDGVSRLFRLIGFPLVAELHSVRRKRPRQRETRHPLLPSLLLLGKKEFRPFTSFTEPSGKIVNSMLLSLGSTRCLSQLGFFSPGAFTHTPESRVRKLTAHSELRTLWLFVARPGFQSAASRERRPAPHWRHGRDTLLPFSRSCRSENGRGR